VDGDAATLARDFFRAEMTDHATYAALARHARRPAVARLLERVAQMERGHARFWESVLSARGESPPAFRPPRLRIALLELLARLFSPLLLVSLLEMGENHAARQYQEVLRSGRLTDKEADRLRRIVVDELEHERLFHRQSRAAGLSNVRDFVLGMNDGLVEILGAVTGLSAAWPGNPLAVAVSGLVVGVAGALSMGIGAFISVRSQRQVDEADRERLDLLFSVAPEKAREAFAERLDEAGLPPELATEVAERLGDNSQALARLMSRPSEADEWRSAAFTGAAYLFGVLFPVLPYFVAERSAGALIGSVLFAGLALAGVGALIALFSGISLRTKVAEMLISGLSAAGLAWLFGRLMQNLFGVAV